MFRIFDILGSIDNKIENNERIINNLELLAINEYTLGCKSSVEQINLEDVIKIYDNERIPLSSRERSIRQGVYPYYGATGILDYVDNYIFSGEYILLAEDGTVIDEKGYPIVQLVNGDFWVNNHAHILHGKNGYSNYLLYIALKLLPISEAVTGAVQLKINQANMCKLKLPKLNNNAVISLNELFNSIFSKILSLQKENRKLQELKGLYLKKFFDYN